MRDKNNKGSLRQLAARGAAYEMLGYGGSQVLRLISNLILARLLFPEAFGLTALVGVVMHGLIMLSDVGIQPSIIQNHRGDEPDFLNTAWTIQVARGFLLWIIAALLAWPISQFYEAPELLWLLPAGSLSVVFAGLNSTSLFTLRRHLRIGLINIIEISTQLLGVIVMVAWALISPTVWALVAGGLTVAFARMSVSHLVPVGYRNRLQIDKRAAAEIIHFGKWIFGSSSVLFLGQQGDRLLLGHLVSISFLGVYSIAILISDAIGAAVNRLTAGVVFGIFSRVRRDGNDRLKDVYYKTRLRLDMIFLPGLGALTVLGSWLIDILYDERYSEAGWILQLLCIRVAMSSVLVVCESCLFSLGQTQWSFYRSIARTIWVIFGILIFFPIAGIKGLVWIVALSEIPVLLVLWIPFYRQNFLRIERELLALALFGSGIAVGILLKLPLTALSTSFL